MPKTPKKQETAKRPRGRPRKEAPKPIPKPSTNGTPSPPPTPAPPPANRYLYGDQLASRDISYLWAGFIPRAMPTLMYGCSLTGKSSVLRSLAAAVTAGRAPTGRGTAPPGRVLWLAGEEPIEEVVRPRLEASGADLSRVCFPQRLSDGTHRGWRLLEQGEEFLALCKREEIVLAIIDPVACFLGGEALAESNVAAREVYGLLTRIGSTVGTTSVVMKHPKKSGRGSSMEQISGGLEWFNTPRSVLLVGRHPHKDGVRVVLQQKPSLSEDVPGMEFQIVSRQGGGVVEWSRSTDVLAQDVQGEEMSRSDRTALDEAKQFLRDQLTEGECKTTTLQDRARDAGLAWITIRRAKDEFGIEPVRRSDGESSFYVWGKPEKGWA